MDKTLEQRDSSSQPLTLHEIFKFTKIADEPNTHIQAYSASRFVKNNIIQLSSDGRNIELSFETNLQEELVSILRSLPEVLDVHYTEHSIEVREYNLIFEIVGSIIKIKFDSWDISSTEIFFEKYGLSDLFFDHSIPNNLTSDYVDSIIESGFVQVGMRKIPINYVSDIKDLKNLNYNHTEEELVLYHGTSVKRALSIARTGLFMDKPTMTRPVLSNRPYLMSLKLASNNWEGYPRDDQTGYGAIIVFKDNKDEYILRSDPAGDNPDKEEIYQTKREITDPNQLYKLRSMTSDYSRGGSEAGYVPPELIQEIIIVKH